MIRVTYSRWISFLPDLNIAIEVDGLYFHSTKFKPANYHYRKRLLLAKHKIHLISITSNDLRDLQKVKGMITEEVANKPDDLTLVNLTEDNLIIDKIPVEEFWYFTSGRIK